MAAGEVQVAFVNHYYLYQALEEQGEDFPARNYYLKNGDPGALVLAAGAGILTPQRTPRRRRASSTSCSPRRPSSTSPTRPTSTRSSRGSRPAEELVPLSEIQSPEIDLSNLDDLQGTLELLQETGVL